MSITIIADDLTGANDTAVAFASRGLRTATALRAESTGKLRESGYEVIACSTESRTLPPERARAAVLRFGDVIAGPLGQIIYKKIDSALRGPIAAELDALLQASPGTERILVAPAFPATGRTTVAGEQRIGDRPVHLTEMAHDPVTPVRISHIPTLLSERSRHGVHTLSLEVIDGGVDAITNELAALPPDVRYVVADAVSDSHLDALAELVLRDDRILPCGSAGLAAAIGRHLAAQRPHRAHSADPVDCDIDDGGLSARSGGLLFVVGSKSPRALRQIQTVEAGAPWVKHVPMLLESLAHTGGDPRGDRPLDIEALAEGIAAAVTSSGVAALYPVGEEPVAPERITAALASITRAAAAISPIGAFLLTGGETAAHVLAGLGAIALEIRAEYEPGICVGRILGGVAAGASLITKAGSFGSGQLLLELAEAWREGTRSGSATFDHPFRPTIA